MANFNKVILAGNLTADPEVRYTPKGTPVGDLRMAINRIIGGGDGGEKREETTYVDVTLWGRNAELAQQYLEKGRPVLIEGRLQLDTWEDKNSGQKRSKLKVVGEIMQFLGGPPRDGGGQRQQRQSSQDSAAPRGGSPAAAHNKGNSPTHDAEFEEDDDDIPF